MATNEWPARGLNACRARAQSSLPVPLAPNTNVVMSDGAIFSIVRQTLSIWGLDVMIPIKGMF